MCICWIYLFNLNEGKGETNYQQFAPESLDAVIPTLTLCLDNPFLNDRLAEFGIDNNSYLSLLAGKSFDVKTIKSFSKITLGEIRKERVLDIQ